MNVSRLETSINLYQVEASLDIARDKMEEYLARFDAMQDGLIASFKSIFDKGLPTPEDVSRFQDSISNTRISCENRHEALLSKLFELAGKKLLMGDPTISELILDKSLTNIDFNMDNLKRQLKATHRTLKALDEVESKITEMYGVE